MKIALVAMAATIVLLITGVVYGIFTTNTTVPVMCSHPSLPAGDAAKLFIPQDSRFHIFVCNADGVWQALN